MIRGAVFEARIAAEILSAARCARPASANRACRKWWKPTAARSSKTGLGVGYCARPGAVDVRLTASGAAAGKTVRQAKRSSKKFSARNIFGF
jgi:hypothetical protein